MDYIASLKYYTLLMKAKDDGEDIVEGVVPDSYFDQGDAKCSVLIGYSRDE